MLINRGLTCAYFQRYLAHFRTETSYALALDRFGGPRDINADQQSKISSYLAFKWCRIFEAELVDFIVEAVTADMKAMEAKQRRGEDFSDYKISPAERQEALNLLSKVKEPLGTKKQTITALWQAVSPQSPVSGLPYNSAMRTTRVAFLIQAIFKQYQTKTPSTVTAPFRAHSFAFLLFGSLFKRMMVNAEGDTVKDKEEWCLSIFQYAFTKSTIVHIPWYQKHEGTGRPSKKPSIKAFLQVEAPNRSVGDAGPLLNPTEQIRATTAAALEVAMQSHRDTEWSALDFKLEQLVDYLHKNCPPSEFNLESGYPEAEPGNLTQQESYFQSAIQSYRTTEKNNKIHHLALIIAIIVSRMVPHVIMPRNRKVPRTMKQTSEILKWVQQLELSDRAEKSEEREEPEEFEAFERFGGKKGKKGKKGNKGNTEPGPYITAVMVYCIVLMDDAHPLHAYMKKNRKSDQDFLKKMSTWA